MALPTRLTIAGAALLLVAACQSAPAQRATDDVLKAKMAANIEYAASVAGGIRRNADYSLDIAVRDGVVFVAASDLGVRVPEQLCRSVAAITNDQNTAKPLGVLAVVVMSGKDKLAECKP